MIDRSANDEAKRGHYGKTVAFATHAERAIFEQDVRAAQFVQRRASSGHIVATFDARRNDLAGDLAGLIAAKGIASAAAMAALPSLGSLHTILPDRLKDLDDSELNEMSRQFYDTDERFLATYHRLLREALLPVIGTDFLFQKTPTIRFHFPHQSGFNWRPRYHTDVMLGHPPQEINVWLPLTRCFATNTMRIATLEKSFEILEELRFDFEQFALKVQTDPAFSERCLAATEPVELQYGQFLIFDSRCIHATQNNVTDATRISLDFRILPVAEYHDMRIQYRGTGRLRMPFRPGDYYAEQSVEAIG